MTTHLTKPEQEALLTLALMAAFADGGKSDVERAEVKRITESLDGGDLNTSALYQRVLLHQATLASTVAALAAPETHQLAYEMAVCVCEADDALNEAEQRFLAEQQVAEELGVKYVLEGSVQSFENRLRITAQLIDALSGKHLWAERYNRDRKDLSAILDEITAKINIELNVKLVHGEKLRGFSEPSNLDYHYKMAKATSYLMTGTLEGTEQARRIYEEAIQLEPEAAKAHELLSTTYLILSGSSKSRARDLEKAFELAQKAIELNTSYGGGHMVLGNLYVVQRQYDKAVSEMEQAVALSPNNDECLSSLAGVTQLVRAK